MAVVEILFIFISLGLFAVHIVNIIYSGSAISLEFMNSCDAPLQAYLIGGLVISSCVLLLGFIVLWSWYSASSFGALTLLFMLVWNIIGSIWYNSGRGCQKTAPIIYQQVFFTLLVNWVSFGVGFTMALGLAIMYNIHTYFLRPTVWIQPQGPPPV
ncbi:uncharacterized protein VTP21DRAFT_705 [Calcarisporiella thermophila]|uniref:uncharacterized protein n=1 Tax=Calcarisporiella thermophila TaxID=911321 RepID=UPI003741F825